MRPASDALSARTMDRNRQRCLGNTPRVELRELQKLENDLHAEAEARMAEMNKAEGGKNKAGTVLKKETLSDTPDTTRTIVTTSAVLAIVVVAGIILVLIIRKRREEEE